MQKRLIGIAVLAASLAVVAMGGFLLLRGETSSGDVSAIEDALRPEIPAPVELGPVPPSVVAPEEPESARDEHTEPQASEPLAAPIGLRIDKLDVDAPVGAYGVNQATGEMAVPDNVTDVGWYKFGPSPGEVGSAVLAAHVDLASSGPGVFFDLRTLEEGDRVVVLYEDGAETAFRVVARVNYEKDELPLDVIFSREGPAVLTLITCGGGFNSDLARYDSNVVVYAVPDLGTTPAEGSTL